MLFRPTENLDIRYSYDRSEQDRKGGARAVWEIGPKNIFTLPNGIVFNTNAHAQAYENAFGILYDDQHRELGFPGGVLGEYETRVAHDTNGLQLDLDRQTLDVNWDITDALTFRALAGDRLQTRRLMVDFDSDSRVFFADRQDNDEIDEKSYELQLLGSHGDREQFNWVFGYYDSERTTSRACRRTTASVRLRPHRRTRTLPRRHDRGPRRMLQQSHAGASTADQFRGHAANDARRRFRRCGTPYTANPTANTHLQLPRRDACLSGRSGRTELRSSLDITDFETDAYSRTSAGASRSGSRSVLGARSRRTTTRRHYQVRGTNITEYQPWDHFQYHLRDPFGYTR